MAATKAKHKKHNGWVVKRQATIRPAKIIDRLPAFAAGCMAESFELVESPIPDIQPTHPEMWVEKPKSVISRVAILLGILHYDEVRAIENAIVLAVEDGTLGLENLGKVHHLRLVAVK